MKGWTTLRIALFSTCLVCAAIDAAIGHWGWCAYMIGAALLQGLVAEVTGK